MLDSELKVLLARLAVAVVVAVAGTEIEGLAALLIELADGETIDADAMKLPPGLEVKQTLYHVSPFLVHSKMGSWQIKSFVGIVFFHFNLEERMLRLFAYALLFATGLALHAEPTHEDAGTSLVMAKPLQSESSPFGDVVLFENPRFGRVLAVNGAIQSTEADAAIAAEMMAHVPLLAHGKASAVLILGGGDGALLAEVLKHPGVAHVVVVEPNTALVALAKANLPRAASAFQDARVELVSEDPVTYIHHCMSSFDVILCSAPGPTAFTGEFFATCKKLLQKGGILVSQSGLPFLQKNALPFTRDAQQSHFKHTRFYTVANPSSLGGLMAFAMASNKKYRTSQKVLTARAAKLNAPLFYYTPAVHRAAFVLPAFMQRQLEKN